MRLCLIAIVVIAAPAIAQSQTSGPLRIDLGMHTGRSDTAAAGWTEWQVSEGDHATREFSGVHITLRPLDPASKLSGVWSKKGLSSGAAMSADGVAVDSGGMEIQLDGLKPGPHSLATFHNRIDNESSAEKYSVMVSGAKESVQVTPSHAAFDDDLATSAYVVFTANPDAPVIVHIESGASRGLILNGLELDASDPSRRATKPSPADMDWHADADDGQLQLRWTAPKGAIRHHVYLSSSTDPAAAEKAVASADETSPGFVGSVDSPTSTVSVNANDSLVHYRWRVDSVAADDTVTRGAVWAFRPRHLAFPTAEGYGRFAIGGRGGRVVKVTNLDDSGPGSLRAAVELDEPRTVVFDVSGRIILKSRLAIRNPYLTIAGQTAPGLGVCISNYNLGMLGAHDVIVRYLRVRPGNTAGETLDGMGMASSDHAIIDHSSISWTQDEAFSSRGARHITLQRTLISEALNIAGHRKYEKGKEHGYAASIGGNIGSFHHNLLAHCSGRNWSLAGGLDQATRHAGRLDIRNNVVFNWGHRTTDGGAKEVNFVNNYYKPGPASRVFHVLMAEREAVPAFGPQTYYVAGNVMEGRFDADDRYAGVLERRGEPLEQWTVDEPFFPSYVVTETAEDAFRSVLGDVGCNLPALDKHDQRVIRETLEGAATYRGGVSGLAGLPDSQDDVGGWEDYPEIHRHAEWDGDGDGMPTAWELEQGLDSEDPSDGNQDADADGYTNLEEYLNE